MVVLDTDILVAFMRGNGEAIDKIRKYYDDGIPVLTTSITTFELFRGVHASTNPEKNMRDVESLIEDIDILQFDTRASRIVSKLYGDLKRKENLVDILDQFIAGITIANNETLVTRNVKHFSKMRSLTVERW